jgi:cell division protein YceG involved in septum cleavage
MELVNRKKKKKKKKKIFYFYLFISLLIIFFFFFFSIKLQDLLKPENSEIRIREGKDNGVFVSGIEWV